MDSLPLSFVLIFGLLMLISHLAGAMMANWSFRDVGRFQNSLLEEWKALKKENDALGQQVFGLRTEILELRQRLNIAEEQLAQFSLTTE